MKTEKKVVTAGEMLGQILINLAIIALILVLPYIIGGTLIKLLQANLLLFNKTSTLVITGVITTLIGSITIVLMYIIAVNFALKKRTILKNDVEKLVNILKTIVGVLIVVMIGTAIMQLVDLNRGIDDFDSVMDAVKDQAIIEQQKGGLGEIEVGLINNMTGMTRTMVILGTALNVVGSAINSIIFVWIVIYTKNKLTKEAIEQPVKEVGETNDTDVIKEENVTRRCNVNEQSNNNGIIIVALLGVVIIGLLVALIVSINTMLKVENTDSMSMIITSGGKNYHIGAGVVTLPNGITSEQYTEI